MSSKRLILLKMIGDVFHHSYLDLVLVWPLWPFLAVIPQYEMAATEKKDQCSVKKAP